MEAMAVSKPVIVTSLGGLPEMVDNGENGYVVSPFNTEELSTALTAICKLDANQLKLMGEKSMQKAKNSFDSKKYIEELVLKYNELLSE